jgi:ubiquitin carboxyl-terminal hydrolase 7
MGTTAMNSSQRGDAFYFEVLEMSLAELDTRKSIKLMWLSEGMTKEVSFDAQQDGQGLQLT